MIQGYILYSCCREQQGGAGSNHRPSKTERLQANRKEISNHSKLALAWVKSLSFQEGGKTQNIASSLMHWLSSKEERPTHGKLALAWVDSNHCLPVSTRWNSYLLLPKKIKEKRPGFAMIP